MSNPYVGEVRMFGGNFPPQGWALCNGQLLQISDNETLFSLIGTTYGGDGQTTFALPNLQSRVPMHQGQGTGLSSYVEGQIGGVETVTLTLNQMPSHSHGVNATTAPGSLPGPGPTAIPATPTGGTATNTLYVVPGTSALVQSPMAATSVGPAGGSQPHDNMMPFLCTNFIISLYGVYPSRN